MAYLQILAAVAGVALAGYPLVTYVAEKAGSLKLKDSAPTYQSAMANLAVIRLRLLRTDLLKEPQKTAIDALTLALVEGSDK